MARQRPLQRPEPKSGNSMNGSVKSKWHFFVSLYSTRYAQRKIAKTQGLLYAADI